MTPATTETIDFTANILDVRDIITRFEELETKYTLLEILKETQNAYGHDKFKKAIS